MIDAWEILGRMAADTTFRDNLFNQPFTANYPVDLSARVKIPGADFEIARNALRPTIQGPLSLAGISEILTAMRFPNFKLRLERLCDAIALSGLNVAGRSPAFYAALGA